MGHTRPRSGRHGGIASKADPRRRKLVDNIALAEYKRASAAARRPVKVSLIGPDRIIQRFDYEASRAVYPDADLFAADVVNIERRMVQELVEAGCRYVHIDAPGFTAYADEPSLAAMRARGEDPAANLSRAILAEAAVVRGFEGCDVRYSPLSRQPAQHVAP